MDQRKDSIYSKTAVHKTVRVEPQSSKLGVDSEKDDKMVDGKMMQTFEAKLTRKAVNDYATKKSRYFKSKRLFDGELIASKSKGSETEVRADLVRGLLGNSREAKSI